MLRLAELLRLPPEFPLNALSGLQNAHDRIVEIRVHEKCRTVMRCQLILSEFRSGKISREELKQKLGMDEAHVADLLSGSPGSILAT